MPTKERTHRWRHNAAAIAAARFRPEKGGCIVRSIVVENEGQGAGCIAEPEVGCTANVSVFRTNYGIVIDLGQLEKSVVLSRLGIDREIGW